MVLGGGGGACVDPPPRPPKGRRALHKQGTERQKTKKEAGPLGPPQDPHRAHLPSQPEGAQSLANQCHNRGNLAAERAPENSAAKLRVRNFKTNPTLREKRRAAATQNALGRAATRLRRSFCYNLTPIGRFCRAGWYPAAD